MTLELLKSEPDLYFSKSAAECYFRCPELWAHKYPGGVRTKSKDILPARGNVLHAGICGGILADGEGFAGAMSSAMEHPDYSVVQSEGADEQALIEAVLWGAVPTFNRLREQVKVLSTEQKLVRDSSYWFPETGTSTVRFAAQNDGILNDGTPFVFELKTTKSYVNHQYWTKAEINFQTHYYLDEVRQHGFPVDRCCWQVVKLPTQKMYRFSESGLPLRDYVRKIGDMMADDTVKWFPFVEIKYDAAKIEDMQRDRDYLVRRMLFDKKHGYGRNTGACFDFQRTCEMFPVCHDGDTVENTELYTLRRDR